MHHKVRPPHRRRPLAHGDLRILVLSLIAEQPRHGYELMTAIEARTAGRYKPSPGVIYPALEVLLDTGVAEVRPDGGKKVFHITDAGRTELVDSADHLGQINARLDGLANDVPDADGEDRTTVRMAMHRLHHDVRKIMHDDVDTKREAEIIAVLERARQDIVGGA